MYLFVYVLLFRLQKVSIFANIIIILKYTQKISICLIYYAQI